VHRLGGLHHFDLLNHPRVYAQIRRWLEQRPEGPRPDAPTIGNGTVRADRVTSGDPRR
jgi:hypothetical protein